ncbi:hypothetical protein PIROE2DRAFT_17306 [Piromyces sp. E2]|nr:hypothetical protein PIROE2DRAFT_17306 [Piromyces sp. E2]|eukprot:OUM57644.1 hypothetical protein PIROE2DRAFT_17306 [Piromyces sp. E2]
MVFYNLFILIYFWGLIGYCYGSSISDYLKGTDRTFNDIEGKVVDVHISMKDKDYESMIEKSQFSIIDYYVINHANIPQSVIFETKVNLTITIDDDIKRFEKVNLKTGGNYARTNAKIGLNLKLKDQSFFGRKNLRLRPDYYDLTRIRSKLVTDLMNRWEIPTIQETYAQLFINGHRFGLYFLMDAIKPSWVSQKYKIPEDEVKTLYYCNKFGMSFDPESIKDCQNEKDKYINYTQPLYDVVNTIYNYTTISQLKQKFDVDNLRKIMISEYLFGSFDNFLIGGHNLHYYQQPNGKWQVFTHDFDSVFLSQLEYTLQYMPLVMPKQNSTSDYATVKFDEWYSPNIKKPFVDIIYYSDKKNFIKILKEMLITGFNPDELFPRIDEMAKLVAPYVENDLTVNEDGIYPGEINIKGQHNKVDMDIYWQSVNYGSFYRNIGLKQFIELKFDSVCKHYGFNKKEILRKAALYRKKREIKNRIDDLTREINR